VAQAGSKSRVKFRGGSDSNVCLANGSLFVKKTKRRCVSSCGRIYVWYKQTLTQLAERYGKSIRWVQRQLDAIAAIIPSHTAQPIIAVTDTTFCGCGYGILVIRCSRLKKNVHFREVRSETPAEYAAARRELESQGFTIEAAVIDGKCGVLEVFQDIPIQLCPFHQIAIVRRYLTSRPQLEIGKELRALTLSLPVTTENTFRKLLLLWHERWKEFLKERTYSEDKKRWSDTHKRIRSAYRSLTIHVPYLLTFQKYPHLKIPNTTNSMDGFFSKLKQMLNTHRGMTPQRRYKMIQEILAK